MPKADLTPARETPLRANERGFNQAIRASSAAVMEMQKAYAKHPYKTHSGRQIAVVLERLALAIGDAFIAAPDSLVTAR